ncbi:hypothetical protein HDU93_001874 [Gonapodya sp. JEL0774]|nr:hypothetical protein HDU93_001874 [Gonapodya sp. JEL0774]
MAPVRNTFLTWLVISVSGIGVLSLAKRDIDRRRRRALENTRSKAVPEEGGGGYMMRCGREWCLRERDSLYAAYSLALEASAAK